MGSPIVYGVVWHEVDLTWPGRNQLIQSLSRFTPVVFLEAAHRNRRFEIPRPRLEEVDEQTFVLRNALSARTLPRAGRLPGAAHVDAAWLRSALRGKGLADFTYWLTVAEPRMLTAMPRNKLVYDCMDPNFLPERQRRFDRDESLLASKAQLTFASAQVLHERMLRINPRSVLLPNAASLSTLQAARSGSLTRPPLLEGVTGPVAGYLGTLDWRFDATSVEAAARALPDCTFAIVGRINREQESAVQGLRGLPNVILPGQVSAAEGDAYAAAFDVALIPFKQSPMNDAINPVKMYNYLILGKPVVATSVEECRRNPFVTTADTAAEFASAVAQALHPQGPAAMQERIEFALANTWDVRAEQAWDELRRHGVA